MDIFSFQLKSQIDRKKLNLNLAAGFRSVIGELTSTPLIYLEV